MTHNRKAELQRKLGMAPLPTPPPGLAQRIKDEIPSDLLLNVEKERDGLRRSVSFDVRIAASILLLISAAFAGLHLLSRSQTTLTTSSRAKAGETQIAEGRPAPSAQAAPLPIAAADNEPRIFPSALPPAHKMARRVKEEEGAPALAGRIKASEPTVWIAASRKTATSAQSAGGSTAPPAEALTVLKETPLSPTETANAALDAVAKSPVQQGSRAPQMADAAPHAPAMASAAAPSRAERSTASKSLRRQDLQFGTPVASFAQAEESLRSGRNLDSSKATALIEHFAAPTDLPASSLRLEAEAIVLPSVEPDTLFLRVSIDGPAGQETAFDLRLSIEPSRDLSDPSKSSETERSPLVEPEFLPAASMTRVDLIHLRPGLLETKPVASVRLRYRDAGGREQSLERRILPTDVTEWKNASSRGRAATLAAALLFRLQQGKPVAPLAAIARENGMNELAKLIDSAAIQH